MNLIFVDTSYILALELANDQNHVSAVRHWHGLVQSLPELVMTSYVFNEVVTFFNHRGYHAKAVEVGGNLLQSPSVKIIHVDEALFYEGWAYFQRHSDKRYSLTDSISFVMMQKLAIRTAFSFDRHFAQAGFAVAP